MNLEKKDPSNEKDYTIAQVIMQYFLILSAILLPPIMTYYLYDPSKGDTCSCNQGGWFAFFLIITWFYGVIVSLFILRWFIAFLVFFYYVTLGNKRTQTYYFEHMKVEWNLYSMPIYARFPSIRKFYGFGDKRTGRNY